MKLVSFFGQQGFYFAHNRLSRSGIGLNAYFRGYGKKAPKKECREQNQPVDVLLLCKQKKCDLTEEKRPWKRPPLRRPQVPMGIDEAADLFS